jgi:hypothetical protein
VEADVAAPYYDDLHRHRVDTATARKNRFVSGVEKSRNDGPSRRTEEDSSGPGRIDEALAKRRRSSAAGRN